MLQTNHFSTTPDKKDEKNELKSDVKGPVSKLKLLWKQYGFVSVATYSGLYLSTLSGLFLLLDYDVFNAATVGLDPAIAVLKVF